MYRKHNIYKYFLHFITSTYNKEIAEYGVIILDYFTMYYFIVKYTNYYRRLLHYPEAYRQQFYELPLYPLHLRQQLHF